MYQDHISYFHSVHTIVFDGFIVISCSFISRMYPEPQKYCTALLIVILFQTMAFENNKLSINRQVFSNRFYASAVKLFSGIHKNVKNTDLDQKIKSIGFL